MNAVYAANDLPAYFAYYSPDFTQWLPEGHTDLPQYEKMWTGFIKSGGGWNQINFRHASADGPERRYSVASYRLQRQNPLCEGCGK